MDFFLNVVKWIQQMTNISLLKMNLIHLTDLASETCCIRVFILNCTVMFFFKRKKRMYVEVCVISEWAYLFLYVEGEDKMYRFYFFFLGKKKRMVERKVSIQ
jgi:hypothetical protein